MTRSCFDVAFLESSCVVGGSNSMTCRCCYFAASDRAASFGVATVALKAVRSGCVASQRFGRIWSLAAYYANSSSFLSTIFKPESIRPKIKA